MSQAHDFFMQNGVLLGHNGKIENEQSQTPQQCISMLASSVTIFTNTNFKQLEDYKA